MTRAIMIRRLAELPVCMDAREDELFAASQAAIAARTNLEEVTASLYLSGTIDGRNAEIRDAQILLQTRAAREHLRECEREEAQHKCRLRYLEREFSALKAIARLLQEGDE